MSAIGPVITKNLYGHTYESQNLAEQNQTPIMTNARSIALLANDVFEYDKYLSSYRKDKTTFKNVRLKSPGKIGFKIGNAADESWQGDKKEYQLMIEVSSSDTWSSIIEKLNNEGQRLLQEDPDFRGIKFEKRVAI